MAALGSQISHRPAGYLADVNHTLTQFRNFRAKRHVSRTARQQVFFDKAELQADLRQRTVRGGVVTLGAQGIRFVLTTASFVVLARLLTPDDYGLIAMVTAIIGLAGHFKDIGLAEATIQREHITHDQVSTLFWLNTAISTTIALLIAAAAPAIANFYGEPRLVAVTLVLAANFAISGLLIQHQALLRRAMHFNQLAVINIASLIISVAAGIISAAMGAGYWALVIMPSAAIVSSVAGMWIACPWRPGRPVRGSGVRSMLAMGGNFAGFNIINYAARNLDNVLIGRWWGTAELGLYNRAYGLLMLPLTQINGPMSGVAVPAMSRLQNDPPRFRRFYLKAISLLTAVTMPLSLGLLALADEAVLVLLGDQWTEAATIFRFLAISSVVQPITNTVGWLYISRGRTDRMLQWGLIGTPIICLSFAAGLPWGGQGVALAYALTMVGIITIPCLWYATRGTMITLLDIAGAVWQPIAAAGIAALCTFAVRQMLVSTLPPAAVLTVGLITMAAIYAAITLAPPTSRAFYRGLLADVMGKGKKAA